MQFRSKFGRLIIWAGVAIPLIVVFTNCDNGFVLEKDSKASYSSLSATCGPSQNLAPNSIDEVVTMINQLPKPLSVACFLSHFKKPLKVFAVDNQFSAQPSQGRESPRIFIFSGNLVVSVVPAGASREFVEFSQLTSSSLSIKGELAFPVTENILPSAPYARISEEFGGTSCRICHQLEARATNITTGEAYNSFILRPDPFKRVEQPSLQWFSQRCDSKVDAERCRILNAVFISGQAQDAEFPDKPQ